MKFKPIKKLIIFSLVIMVIAIVTTIATFKTHEFFVSTQLKDSKTSDSSTWIRNQYILDDNLYACLNTHWKDNGGSDGIFSVSDIGKLTKIYCSNNNIKSLTITNKKNEIDSRNIMDYLTGATEINFSGNAIAAVPSVRYKMPN